MSLHAHGVPAAVVCGPPLLPSELLWLVALGITPPLMPKWCHLHVWFVATPTCSLDGAAQQKVAGSEIYHGSFGVRFAYIYIYIGKARLKADHELHVYKQVLGGTFMNHPRL